MKENLVIINLDNIINNYKVLEKKINKKSEINPVLKSEAYGSGIIKVAEILIKNGCNSFFVFHINEGIELRKKFKNKIENIYVLSPFENNQENLLNKYKLTQIVENFKQLDILESKNIKYGIFFNTGMNRNGFNVEDINKIKNSINNNNLKIVISHLACPDEIENSISKKQIKNFEIVSKNFPNALKSLLSINAIMNYDKYYDIVRPGIGIVYTEKNKNFKNTITVKSYVKSIKGNIAKIPFGINNGIPEIYAKNGGTLYINKKIYKIKNIKLNYTTIEIDKNVNLNDEVIIVDEKHNIGEIAEKTKYNEIKMSRREIAQRMVFSKKNKKYYILDGKIIKRKITYKKYNNINIINHTDKIETKIFNIIKVNENGFVGYGGTEKVKKGDILASVYGGYCDGISRYLSNNGYFEIFGIKCKIIGKVSMDQTTILIDEKIKNIVKIGDKAYLNKKENLIDNFNKYDFFFMLNKSRRVKNVNKLN